MSFDKKLFADLVERAKGDRSINKYSEECGISPTHISRLLRELVDTAPSPDTIKCFSSVASNGVTYEDLMKAAGHLDNKFTRESLRNLRGNKSYYEYAIYLEEKTGIKVSPDLIEAYERGDIPLKQTFVDFVLNAEYPNIAPIIDVEKDKYDLSFMYAELKNWVTDPNNIKYLEFIYSAYKAGISKELLDYAEISIKIKK